LGGTSGFSYSRRFGRRNLLAIFEDEHDEEDEKDIEEDMIFY